MIGQFLTMMCINISMKVFSNNTLAVNSRTNRKDISVWDVKMKPTREMNWSAAEVKRFNVAVRLGVCVFHDE